MKNIKKLKIPVLAELGLIALVWQLFPVPAPEPGSGKAPGQCLHSNQDTARARRPAGSWSQRGPGGQGSIVPRNKWQCPETQMRRDSVSLSISTVQQAPLGWI